MVQELTRVTDSQRQALQLAGVSRSTWHYRRNPRARALEPVPQKQRAYPSRITPAQRAVIVEKITAAWEQDNSVDHAFASAWDAGIMIASRRSWWRIAAEIQDQSARPVVPSKQSTTTPRAAPVLEATEPGQVWSWDITDLRTPWRGKAFKAYSIIDIYSRMIVGWRVEERESDQLAVQMFESAFARHTLPETVHADSGPAMRSSALKDLLSDLGIDQTHNRPRVSNDNPFSESEFRTMKYRPNYPGTFDELEAARAYLAEYVPWYNQNHRHSGIALFTPAEVHDGSWHQRWGDRDQALQAYYDQHPERFHRRPHTAAPAGLVGINLPKTEPTETDTQRLQAA